MNQLMSELGLEGTGKRRGKWKGTAHEKPKGNREGKEKGKREGKG